MTTILRGGRVICPSQGIDRVADLRIADGRIAEIGPLEATSDDAAIEHVDGRIVCPGLVDLAARPREPGATRKATIASEAAAAAHGGITTLCCPPDTDPPVDTPATVELIHQRARAAQSSRVRVLGALTSGLQGGYLAPMGALARAGCIALSQAEVAVRDSHVLRSALAYAATHGLTVLLPPREPVMSAGCAHEGAVASRLGLPAIPVAAETAELARIVELARDTGAHVHASRLSSRIGVALLRRAQADGVRITADVAAHQLHLSDAAVDGFDTRAHVRPPLRSDSDRRALREGVADGAISAVCSDHQPHDSDAKQLPFAESAPGISALETLLPLAVDLADSGESNLSTALARVTHGPARIVGLGAGNLAPGQPADVCVFRADADWLLSPSRMVSRGANTPFDGSRLKARVESVWIAGRRLEVAPAA